MSRLASPGSRFAQGVAVLLLALPFAAKAQNATTVPTITFDSSADYDNAASPTTGQFRDTLNGSGINRVTAADNSTVLRFTGTAGQTAVALYDASPTDSTNESTFLNSTIRTDFRILDAANSMGIHARVAPGTTIGYTVVVNIDISSGTTDQIRLFTGGDINAGTAGTQAATFTSAASALSLNTFYTLELTTTNITTGGVQLVANVFAQGTTTAPLLTLSYSDTSGGALTGAGRVALRGGFAANGNSEADNFTVVPEPSVAALLTGAVALAGARRRRRA